MLQDKGGNFLPCTKKDEKENGSRNNVPQQNGAEVRSSQVSGGGGEQESRTAVQDAKVRVVIHDFIHDGLDNDKIYIYI